MEFELVTSCTRPPVGDVATTEYACRRSGNLAESKTSWNMRTSCIANCSCSNGSPVLTMHGSTRYAYPAGGLPPMAHSWLLQMRASFSSHSSPNMSRTRTEASAGSISQCASPVPSRDRPSTNGKTGPSSGLSGAAAVAPPRSSSAAAAPSVAGASAASPSLSALAGGLSKIEPPGSCVVDPLNEEQGEHRCDSRGVSSKESRGVLHSVVLSSPRGGATTSHSCRAHVTISCAGAHRVKWMAPSRSPLAAEAPIGRISRIGGAIESECSFWQSEASTGFSSSSARCTVRRPCESDTFSDHAAAVSAAHAAMSPTTPPCLARAASRSGMSTGRCRMTGQCLFVEMGVASLGSTACSA
mmetsp:Transcript_26222/g.63420  ORF Transcript_26222/g.63420 Transcript_26222/m.63420 type:complete len:356 (-) Transcript_26222:147-1214(-)